MTKENTGKGKAPYIPLYADDFLSDTVVEEMDCAECGIYIRLLLTAWHNANKNDAPPTLLNDIPYLAGAGRTTTDGIAAFFCHYPQLWIQTADGRRIFQKRELKEFARLIEQAIKKKEISLLGVKARNENTDDIAATLTRLKIILGKCKEILDAVPQLQPQFVPQFVPQFIPRLQPSVEPVQSTEYIVHSTENKDIKKGGSSVNRGVGEEENTPPPPNLKGEQRYTFDDFLNDKCTLEELTHEETRQPKGEQLTLQGDTSPTAWPFSAKDFMQLWNRWITANGLQVEKLRSMKPERVKKFQTRQKAFAVEGANSREFWARLLSVAMEANGGFYIGNGTPQAGYSKPFIISFDWLFKNDTHIAKLLEVQTGGGEEWTQKA